MKKNPLKHAKSLTVTNKIEVYHFFDYESDDPIHVQGFQDAMDNMKKAEKLGKQIKYRNLIKLHQSYQNGEELPFKQQNRRSD